MNVKFIMKLKWNCSDSSAKKRKMERRSFYEKQKEKEADISKHMRSITHTIVHDGSSSDTSHGMFNLFLRNKWIILIVEMCYFYHFLLFMLFIIIVDTLPSLPEVSDNDMKKNVPISHEGIIVITDTDTDDDNPPKWYI